MEKLTDFIELYTVECVLLALFIGLVLGVLIAFMWWRKQKQWLDSLQQQQKVQSEKEYTQLQSNYQALQSQLTAMQQRNETMIGREAQLKASYHHMKADAQRVPGLEEQLHQSHMDQRSLEAELKQKGIRLNEQQAFIETTKAQMTSEFSHLGQKILDQKTQKFSEQNKQQINQLVQPIHEQLKSFSHLVAQSKEQSAVQAEALKQQLTGITQLNQALTQKAEDLTQALTAESKTQGNWGEMVLQKLLDLAGLEQGREYQTEVSFTEGSQRKRPDVIINLPDDKSLIVDAKVSLTAYQRYVNADDELERSAALKQHMQSIQSHINGLSAKDYQNIEGLQTVDFVLMFVPIEGALMTAINNETELLEKAYRKNILLVSATNLLATLRTVHMLWQNDKQNKNAREIASRAGKLIDKFSGFYEDFNNIHKQLQKLDGTWESANKKLTTGAGNLYRQMEQLADLGAQNTKKLPSDS